MILRYVDGPLDGLTYPLEPGQPIPREIRHTGWSGAYFLKDGKLLWKERGAK